MSEREPHMDDRLIRELTSDLAIHAATRALAVQADSWEAEAALGLTALFHEWNRERADRHLERALALGPGSAALHRYRGTASSILGRHTLAIAAAETAVDLDPLSASVNAEAARVLLSAGRPEQALVRVERALELDPSFRSALEVKAFIHWALDDAEGAIDTVLEYRSRSPNAYAGAGVLSYLRARSGNATAAREEHRRLEERERVEPGTLLDVDFAISHLGMRQYASAFGRLQKAIDHRSASVILASSMPLWSEVADRAPFKAVRARIGLWS